MEIQGTNALVTGAGSGIGRSISLELAAEGAHVVVVDIDLEAARAVTEEIRADGGVATAYAADVSDPADMERLASEVYAERGSLQILVNNAGVTLRPFRASWDTTLEDFSWVMGVNFGGVLHGHHVFVPRMLQTPGPKHIVNTSSVSTLISFAGHSAYVASKSAIDGFSNSAREELKTQGIGVSVLHPGPIRSRLVESERFRTDEDRSETRGVKPWSDYVDPTTDENHLIMSTSNAREEDPTTASASMEYMRPDAVGRMVVEGIKSNTPYILTHPADTRQMQERFDLLLKGAPGSY